MPNHGANAIELLGFLTGAINVWLLARQNLWNWPVGIANNLLYLMVFVRAGLYGDAALQVAFATLNTYGWWHWRHPGARLTELPVTRTPRHTWIWLVPVTAAAATAFALFLSRYTDSTVPAWDGVTTALSLAATFGQTRKLVESWWLWMAADLIYIPLYVYKNLWLTAALYVLFLTLCAIGLSAWRRSMELPDTARTSRIPGW